MVRTRSSGQESSYNSRPAPMAPHRGFPAFSVQPLSCLWFRSCSFSPQLSPQSNCSLYTYIFEFAATILDLTEDLSTWPELSILFPTYHLILSIALGGKPCHPHFGDVDTETCQKSCGEPLFRCRQPGPSLSQTPYQTLSLQCIT